MAPAALSGRKPRWYLIPVRVVVATFVMTLLSFAVSLLLGIAGVVLAARLRGTRPDLTFAYRHIALPSAAAVAAIVLISATAMEVRHYQRAKTLEEIERAS
jgi:ABC-type dipeptide/oligopeptide/nickel transport system permease component